MLPKQFGPYVVDAAIGSGGMGEVFRATDTRLGRTVAIKVIPPHLATRRELRQRFEIEARAIASLNHPHICALFDIGERDGAAFMVMEHLEGESLASRLKKGPLALEEALRHAVHIADALDQAHRRGVLHRDIKPGNIMLTKSGVKLLDFGLARLRDRVGSAAENDPTASLTQEGIVLGTPHYMSPEQAAGRDTDGRGDIFAFASVLYEAITGKKAFPGNTIGETMSAVVRCDVPPPIEGVPPALNRTLHICWAQDPDERWQSAGDLRRELQWIASAGKAASVSNPGKVGRRELIAWASAAAVIGVAGGAGVMRALRPAATPSNRIRFTVTDSPPALSMNLFQTPAVVSPDGKWIAFTAATAGRQPIFVRAIDSTELHELAGTHNAQSLFWSPDSQWLAFFQDDQLKRIAPTGGPSEMICNTAAGSGGSWNAKDVILFQKTRSGAIFQVPASGGKPVQATTLAPGQAFHVFPRFLPDGQSFLFSAQGPPEQQGIFVGTLGSANVKRISPNLSRAVWAPSGHLLFVQGADLVARRFDLNRMTLEGDVIPVATNIWNSGFLAAFDVTGAGTLVYGEAETPNSQLTWFDRGGRQIEKVGPVGPYIHLNLTRDGRRALLERLDGGRGNLWSMEIDRAIPAPLVSNEGWAYTGVLSPDGSQFAYLSSIGAVNTLYRRTVGAAGAGDKLITRARVGVTDWSADGRYLVYSNADGPNNYLSLIDLSAPPGPEEKPHVYLSAPHILGEGSFSPDGRWMAYSSGETDPPEIFVSPFPNPTAKWRISTEGGRQARWRRDGKELYFLSPDKTLMAAPIPTMPAQAGIPVALFRANTVGYGGRYDYAPAPDGHRFLMLASVGEKRPQTLQVIVGWRP
jgi:serine/threonine protein kinase